MWAASRADVRASLQDASRGATGASAAGRRLRTVLVAGQVALAAALAVQAGLLARSFDQLRRVDPGFQPDHLLTLQMNVPDRHTTADARRAFYQEWFARIEALPGVVAVGGTTRIPLGSTNVSTTVVVQGRAVDTSRLPEVEFRRAMHDYFSAMRIPIRQGREFTAEDGPTAPQVAVVNETLAAQVFPGENPVGQRVALGPSGDGPWLTIVGVIGDVRHGSLEAPPPPELYISYLQNPPVSPFMAVRTSGDPAALTAQLRDVSRALDPSLLLFDIRTMEDLRAASVGERRFTLTLVLAFGLVALTLAAVGVYGTMALMVTERTSELGLRVALGAMPGSVVRLVVGSALKVTAAGLLIGLAVGAAAARLLESQLFGVATFDPVTFLAVPLTLAVAGALAALAPARRAVQVDPLTALRND
jgi:putative ABC transport system permease protein